MWAADVPDADDVQVGRRTRQAGQVDQDAGRVDAAVDNCTLFL
jgi:hypothetical protein